MAQYSKSFEREENRLLNKGIFRSATSVVLCWLPVVSLILAISGFIRVAARITKAHRVKKFFATLLTLIVLIAVLGGHIWAVYVYVRDPGVVDRLMHEGWKKLTGEDTLPWQTQLSAFDYGMPVELDDEDAYNENYDDLNADFDDSELAGFDEDLTDDEAAASDAGNSEAGDLSSSSSLDLYYQMKKEKGLSSSSPVG